MAGAAYSVYLCDPFGVRLADASNFVSLRYSRVVNDIGTATLVLPGTFGTQSIRAPDGRLEIWRRQPDSSREYLDTETVWLIKRVARELDDRGRATIIIEADTPLCILKEPGRFADYFTADFPSSEPAVTDTPWDDAIKYVVRISIGPDEGTNGFYRDISRYVTTAPNVSQAPTGSKTFTWRACLKVMQEMADASAIDGTYLAFDIVAPTPTTLEFRTYAGQRGVDHRFPNGFNPVIIGPEFGNMGECSLTTDWRNEVTFVMAGGRGELTGRHIKTAQDTTRIGASPFGLREKFVSFTNYTEIAGLQEEANAALRNGRPKTIFKGRILDVPDTRYGVHWGWGDYITVQAFGQSFDARIDAIEVSVGRGKESINAWIRGDL